ncbi:hypothetical protein GCM10012319_39410 [Comamonas sp. KCTC 72670]|nr:hypothetical protein GCM10012319_39410 [Comamonas sp. KCTC 72670]
MGHHFNCQNIVEKLASDIYVASIATAVHVNQLSGQATRPIGDSGRNLPHEDGCAFVVLESPCRLALWNSYVVRGGINERARFGSAKGLNRVGEAAASRLALRRCHPRDATVLC